ncbi:MULTISPECIES: NfeD family protein [unclassified Streptomyces]|uniref:NfeD family protein n=1 Tax=unclassified Streptomyces TaxID=2593676 RepID=UPI0022B6DBBC|nr:MULTISPECIES: NfeD family protein [unclassified Streptomyces]MCZ7413537.1 NfeD family protein [Streptomyces sp. WMMC897]MCZ7430532.1 NfeD family protein [Streptomyces sp. WMMC1477]
MDAWVWWLVAAVGLCIPLVLTAMPEMGMLAVGAGAGALAAGLGGGLVIQVVVFCAVSTALIVAVRPVARRMRAERPELATGVDALKGRQAVVVERVDGDGGRVKVAGEIWSARALEPGESYEPGHRVDVVEIDGATAVVM